MRLTCYYWVLVILITCILATFLCFANIILGKIVFGKRLDCLCNYITHHEHSAVVDKLTVIARLQFQSIASQLIVCFFNFCFYTIVNYLWLIIYFQGLCGQTFYGHVHSVNDVTFNLKVSPVIKTFRQFLNVVNCKMFIVPYVICKNSTLTHKHSSLWHLYINAYSRNL